MDTVTYHVILRWYGYALT